jgi:hypothetical protein
MTYIRLTTLQADPSKVEDGIRWHREQGLAIVRQQPGFEGLRLLVDRTSGKMIGVTLWADGAAPPAADSPIAHARGQIAQVVGAPAPTVETFEMVINESVTAVPA